MSFWCKPLWMVPFYMLLVFSMICFDDIFVGQLSMDNALALLNLIVCSWKLGKATKKEDTPKVRVGPLNGAPMLGLC